MTNSWVYILIAIFLHSELSLLIPRLHVSNTKAYDSKYKPCDHSMRVSFKLFFRIYVRLSKMLSSCALMSFISLIWTRVHKCALRVFVSHRRKKSYSKVICRVFVCGVRIKEWTLWSFVSENASKDSFCAHISYSADLNVTPGQKTRFISDI